MACTFIFVPESPNKYKFVTFIVLSVKVILSVSPFSVNDQVIDLFTSKKIVEKLSASLVANKSNVLDTNNSCSSRLWIMGLDNIYNL